mmetsp:Transcript_21849/g.29268  ORF Transcript_21849/g.29268 Transcript_21849/m.29268 type:complete len:143 (-) Transcript_21849:492-920(-)
MRDETRPSLPHDIKFDETVLADAMEMVEEIKSEAEERGQRPFIISILGQQSSGKSTLLNYLFGSRFVVSAARGTKGLNAMLIRFEFNPSQPILVLDSEGLFSIERADPTFDRRMASFCFAFSNVCFVNIKSGGLTNEMLEVL